MSVPCAVMGSASRFGSAGLGVLLALVGCASQPPPPPEPPLRATGAAGGPRAAASAAPDPPLARESECERVGRDQRAALRPYFDEVRSDGSDFDTRGFVRGFCWSDDRGAWGLELSAIQVTPRHMVKIPMRMEAAAELGGRLRIVCVAGDERVAAASDRAFEASRPLEGSTFDWSGDGVPELTFPASNDYTFPEVEIWMAADHRVAPYPPAGGMHARVVRDVDGDGRPDLLYTAPYSGELEIYESVDVTRFFAPEDGGFWLVAHSLADGTFSRDDEVARTWAKRACPDGALDERRGASAPEDALSDATAIRCARLWGVSQAVVERSIARRCKKPHACSNEAILKKWAAAPAPLVLR